MSETANGSLLAWDGDRAVTPLGVYTVRRTPDGYEAAFEGEELAHVGFNAVDFFYGAKRAAQDHAEAHYVASAPIQPLKGE